MILSDGSIRSIIELGRRHNLVMMIEPFREEQLHACSYDLTVGRIVDNIDSEIEEILISPGQTVGLTTEETIRLLGSWCIAALVSMRSGPSRKGLVSTHSMLVDPGYEGKLNFMVTALKEFKVKLGDSLFQIIFFETKEVDRPWTGKSKGFGPRL